MDHVITPGGVDSSQSGEDRHGFSCSMKLLTSYHTVIQVIFFPQLQSAFRCITIINRNFPIKKQKFTIWKYPVQLMSVQDYITSVFC